jgi:3-dehydroquinate synthase
MQKITVAKGAPPQKGYTIHIDSGALEKISSLYDFGQYSHIFIVTDETIEPLLLDKLKAVLPDKVNALVMPHGEKQKNIANAEKIWTALHKAGCDRHTLLINLGGGVVGDIGGFAASTYMRGIPFLNIPTTLLSQVDSSVGGKTGINFDGVKNLVGTFDLPIGVVIDPDILRTLPDREFIAGFGEIIKHGLIRDEAHFEQVTTKKPREFTEDELAAIIETSCRIKLDVVGTDPREAGARKLVNFGHTVGHAIETLSLETGEPLLHGEAISIGMVAEALMSVKLNMLQAADQEHIKQVLKHAGLPASVSGLDQASIETKMRSDKKNRDGKLSFTLLEGIGHAVYDKDVPAPVVTEAIQAILN